jgi:hypothetical protein
MKKSSTGYRGVTQLKNKYQARIRKEGKNVFLGSFPTAEEASLAYQTAAAEKATAAMDLPDPSSIQEDPLKNDQKNSGLTINWSAIKIPDRIEELLAAAVMGSIVTLLVVS